MIKSIAKPTRAKKIFYAKNVHMSASFDKLAEIAEKQLGGELSLGDIIVADNVKGDRRKAMQWTKDGFMIYYGKLHRSRFIALAQHDGQLKRLDKNIF